MLTVFVSMLLAASATPALRVEITSPKTRLSILEPVKLTVRATALRPVIVPAIANTSGSPAMETWIDYGSGFAQYRDVDDTAGVEGGVGGERSLGSGSSFVKTVVLVQGRIGQEPAVPFANPGRYPVRVVFRARPERDGVPGLVLGESNTITFEVAPPDADGQTVVQRLRTEPWILRGGINNAGYDALVQQFPDSVYLHWGRRAIAFEQRHRIGNGQYPDTGEHYAEIGRGHPLTPQLYRRHADELRLANWGQFDEERLRLAAEDLELAGDLTEAKDVWREIVERFPGSEAAEEAKSRIDSTPPSLQVTAAPSSLWPPNHKLVPISVTVSVSDDQDPSPDVRLVSITCNDGCVLAQDIAGAAYGTDDRVLELRSERRGTSLSGRTYTITYEASDASGNKATASTTVIVRHDQSGK